MAQSEFVAFLRVAHRVIGEYLAEVDGGGARASAQPAAAAPDARPAQGAVAAAAPAARGAGSRFEEVRAVLLREVVERTGYPEEMLELDLDLEGDLGIDTVKQVAAIAAVREHFDLDVDPAFRLRDHNTLRKVIAHVAKRLEGAAV